MKKRNGEWFASLVIEKEVEVKKSKPALERSEGTDIEDEKDFSKVGVDIGVKALLVDSFCNYYGTECYEKLLIDIDKMTEYTRHRQKEEACISKKRGEQDFKLPKLRYLKKQAQLSSHRKNEIGRSINECIRNNSDKVFILEDLSLNGKTKSRPINRILNRSLLGYLKDKLRFRLMDKGIDYEGVQPAYSSQECLRCGWVSRNNRKNQEHFKCEYTNDEASYGNMWLHQ